MTPEEATLAFQNKTVVVNITNSAVGLLNQLPDNENLTRLAPLGQTGSNIVHVALLQTMEAWLAERQASLHAHVALLPVMDHISKQLERIANSIQTQVGK